VPRPSVTVKNFTPKGNPEEEGPGLDNDPMYYLQRLYVYFLQNLFRDFPEGCGLRWKPNEEDTEIRITAEKPKPEAVEKTPHIICVLGSSRWTGLGLDQLQTQRASDGQRTHTDLMPVQMIYHCQAKSGTHARRMAWNASLWTNALRRILMRAGGLHHVGVQHDISPEGPLTQFVGNQPDSELIEVRVNVPFYWQPQWRIKRASEVWRNLRILLNVNETAPIYSAGRQNKLRPPMVKGVPVNTKPLDPPGTAFTQIVAESKLIGEE
jgi:hypothetical protein